MNKKYNILLLLLIGFTLVTAITITQTAILNEFWPFIALGIVKSACSSFANQGIQPMITTSVPALVVHKINGISTTLINLA